jgi:hypothetical protein
LYINSINEYEEAETFNVTLGGIQKTGNGSFSLLQESGLELDNGVKLNYTTGLTLAPDSASKITFQDLTEQSTAGLVIDPNEGGINFNATNIYGGMRVSWIEQTEDEPPENWSRIGQINAWGFNFVSEGNPDGDYRYAFADGELIFKDGSSQLTKGDRYKATSSTSMVVDGSNSKVFTTQPNLAYTKWCKIIIYSESTDARMYCTINSYNPTTGVLDVDSATHTGSGTHTDWVINVGG